MMEDWTKRLAVAGIAAFLAVVVGVPVSCGGFVLYNEHLYGDVERGGPQAVLKGFAVAVVLGVVVFAVVWRATRPR